MALRFRGSPAVPAGTAAADPNWWGSRAFFEPKAASSNSPEGSGLEECRMSDAPDFRKWAARVARQAGKEPDATEAQRLMSIAAYWAKLAEIEDWQRDNAVSGTKH